MKQEDKNLMCDEKCKALEEEAVVELSEEALDQVTGAGDPFEGEPRVPVAPIDPELRDDV